MEHKDTERCLVDNRLVRDDHQEGIKRKLQRGHNPKDYEGHFGSMKGGWKHGKSELDHRSARADHFKRSGSPLTPRKA